MKKLLTLTMIAMLIAVSGSAQLIPKNVRYGYDHPTFKPEHEFRIGIGAFPINGIYESNFDYMSGQGKFATDYVNALYKMGSGYETGAISFGYTYRAKRWLEFGVNATFYSEYKRTFIRETGMLYKKNARNCYAIMPTVRFSWLNRDIVRLYSEVGLGLQLVDYKGTIPRHRESEELILAGQITYIGITLGRKLFVYSELGTGTRGVFIIGGGYRFGAKKNNVSNVENFKR